MNGWQKLLYVAAGLAIEGIKSLATYNFDVYEVYPASIQNLSGSLFFIARHEGQKVLVISGHSPYYDEFTGWETDYRSGTAKLCTLDSANSRVLFKAFPFTRPQSHKGRPLTIGLGDRLGLASSGHLQLLRSYDIFPVLAQQSIRELNFTGRTYDEVLSAAAWAVFQEGYTGGYGADGDHLKTRDEILYALKCGFTRITLDCSDHIRNSILSLSEEEINRQYSDLPEEVRLAYDSKYLNGAINVDNNLILNYAPSSFRKTVLLYHDAICYIVSVYRELIKPFGSYLDFEISIDETLSVTTPEDHYFVASELLAGSVIFDSLAPRFFGEFQKGIDYLGDLEEFEKSLDKHCKIAKKLGYRLSVHSGSDKFTVFPLIGEKTEGCFHLKTAGTHWLEALRIVAAHDSMLYRSIHGFSLDHLEEAKKYYKIGADISKIRSIDETTDDELPLFLDDNHSRQVLHITYGLVLTARNSKGNFLFRDEIYKCLSEHEADYEKALAKHLKRHLDFLGIKPLQEQLDDISLKSS